MAYDSKSRLLALTAMALVAAASRVDAQAVPGQTTDIIRAAPRDPNEIVQPLTPIADELARNMRVLAANPRDVDALLSAGKAALRLGDANAAFTLFARAEDVAPRSGGAKAGMASALLMLERPEDALRLFRDATALGAPEADYARDRGLAYDLTGEPLKAQRDYALALRAGPDDETTRRYALSLGITGNRAEALTMIDPLLRKRDIGAWRVRAFVLAMNGDADGARSIARAVMPAAAATAMSPFFGRLAALDPQQKALAVHLGQLPANGARYAAIEKGDNWSRDSAGRPQGDAALASAGEPAPRPDDVEPTRSRRTVSREPRRRPGYSVARSASSAGDAGAGVARRSSRDSDDEAQPGSPAAVTRQRFAVAETSGERPPAEVSRADAQRDRRGEPAPATPATTSTGRTTSPAQTTSPGTSSLAVTGTQTRTIGAGTRPTYATPAPIVRAPAARPVTETASASPGFSISPVPAPAASPTGRAPDMPRAQAPVRLAEAWRVPSALPPAMQAPRATTVQTPPAATVQMQTPPAAAGQAALAPTTQTPPAAGTQTPPAATVPMPPRPFVGPPAPAPQPAPSLAATTPPLSPTAVPRAGEAQPRPLSGPPAPVETRATPVAPSPTPAPEPAAPAVAAASVAGAGVVETPAAATAAAAAEATNASEKRTLAAIIANLEIPESERSAPPVVLPTPRIESPRIKATPKVETDARALTQAKAKAAVDAKAKAAADAKTKAAADAKAKADLAKAKKKDLAKKEAAKPKNPSRHWVQVAGGANKATLPLEWKRLRTTQPKLFAGLSAWLTPLRATNRLLVGPFSSDDAAQAFVNRMREVGLPAFGFTSAEGQAIEQIGSR